jgi:hypothetical protein
MRPTRSKSALLRLPLACGILSVSAAAAGLAYGAHAEGSPTFRDGPAAPESASRSSASRYAALSSAACRKELQKRKLVTEATRGAAPGVNSPVRFTGSIRGVRFLVPGRKSPYGVLDCRLLLALDDLARISEEHGVVEIRIDNFYRPKAHLPGRPVPSQHASGLAADIVGFRLGDGRSLLVARDWHGVLGASACGPDSEPIDPTPETIALRDLVCEVARAGIFHHLLTPNFNAAHEDHLHADIKRGERTRGIR